MGSLANRVLWPAFAVLCALLLYQSWRRRRGQLEVITWALAFVGGLCSTIAAYRPGVVAFLGKLAIVAFLVLRLVPRQESGRPSRR